MSIPSKVEQQSCSRASWGLHPMINSLGPQHCSLLGAGLRLNISTSRRGRGICFPCCWKPWHHLFYSCKHLQMWIERIPRSGTHIPFITFSENCDTVVHQKPCLRRRDCCYVTDTVNPIVIIFIRKSGCHLLLPGTGENRESEINLEYSMHLFPR